MTVARDNHGVAVGDGKLFAVGGSDGSNYLKTVDLKTAKYLQVAF